MLYNSFLDLVQMHFFYEPRSIASANFCQERRTDFLTNEVIIREDKNSGPVDHEAIALPLEPPPLQNI